MNFTQDEVVVIIGLKELELISLRRAVAQLNERLAEFEPKQEVAPDAK